MTCRRNMRWWIEKCKPSAGKKYSRRMFMICAWCRMSGYKGTTCPKDHLTMYVRDHLVPNVHICQWSSGPHPLLSRQFDRYRTEVVHELRPHINPNFQWHAWGLRAAIQIQYGHGSELKWSSGYDSERRWDIQIVCPTVEECCYPSQPTCRREGDDQTLLENPQSILLRDDGRKCAQGLLRDGEHRYASRRRGPRRTIDQRKCSRWQFKKERP